MTMTKSPKNNMTLLEKRDKALQESFKRTENLLEKSSKLGLIDTYRDYSGNIKVKKR